MKTPQASEAPQTPILESQKVSDHEIEIPAIDQDDGIALSLNAEKENPDREHTAPALSCSWYAWASDEAHGMAFEMAPSSFRARPRHQQLKFWFVRFNPLYWLLFYWPIVLCMLFGRAIHHCFGQGGPVRVPELQAEHDTRVMVHSLKMMAFVICVVMMYTI